MANIMGLRMIAEGVETEDQINYLLNMGCIYGQGYFFYKPLPVEEIKILLNDENNVDYRGIQARKIEHIRFKDLFQFLDQLPFMMYIVTMWSCCR